MEYFACVHVCSILKNRHLLFKNYWTKNVYISETRVRTPTSSDWSSTFTYLEHSLMGDCDKQENMQNKPVCHWGKPEQGNKHHPVIKKKEILGPQRWLSGLEHILFKHEDMNMNSPYVTWADMAVHTGYPRIGEQRHVSLKSSTVRHHSINGKLWASVTDPVSKQWDSEWGRHLSQSGLQYLQHTEEVTTRTNKTKQKFPN